MACSMGTSVGYDRARNKVSGGPMAHPLAHCQLESRFQSDTFVSTLFLSYGGGGHVPHCTFRVLNGCIWELQGAFGNGKGAKQGQTKNWRASARTNQAVAHTH
jgi:hypothetical protein